MYNSGNSSKNVTGSSVVDGTVEAADLATAVNNDIADGVAGKATADLALPKTGGTMTGDLDFVNSITNITLNESDTTDLNSLIRHQTGLLRFDTISDDGATITRRMTVDNSDGNVTVNTGNLVIGTAGKGIDFSATSDGSGTMTSEVLDDYEEGTWTPTIGFAGASVGMTYSTQIGTYTKVGNMVTASCYIYLTAKGTSTGTAGVWGLPFTAGGSNDNPSFWPRAITFADFFIGRTNLNTEIALGEVTNAGVYSALTNANFTDTSNIQMTVTYAV